MKIIPIGTYHKYEPSRPYTYNEKTLIKGYKYYYLKDFIRDLIMSITLLIAFCVINEIHFSYKVGFSLSVLPIIFPIIGILKNVFLNYRYRLSAKKIVKENMVKEYGENYYLIKFPKTGIYQVTDLDAFATIGPEQLVDIKDLASVKKYINSYKKS